MWCHKNLVTLWSKYQKVYYNMNMYYIGKLLVYNWWITGTCRVSKWARLAIILYGKNPISHDLAEICNLSNFSYLKKHLKD